MVRKSLSWLGVALLAVGLATAADQPGQVHLIRPQDLPPPFETPSASNGPRVVAQPSGAELQVPDGFQGKIA